MEMKFKSFVFILIFVLSLFAFGCGGNKGNVEFEIELAQRIGVGEEVEIKLVYEGALDASKFEYSVDDESVIEINNGKVKGLAEGLATVYVTYGDVTKDVFVSVSTFRTIEYNLDGGTCSEELQTRVYTGQSYTLPSLTREGYIFQGWYSNPSFAGNPVEVLSDKNASVVKLYAKFRSENYTILYNLYIDGSLERSSDDTNFELSYTLKEPEYDKDKYVFSGWYLDNNYYERVSDFESGYNQDISVYGLLVTKTEDITVKFSINGGKLDGITGTSVTVKPGYTDFPNVTRTGYNFITWYKDSAFKYEAKDPICKSTTLYAKYTEVNPVTSINIDVSDPTVKKGEELEIKYTLNPTNPTVSIVTFKSSDTTIATIDQSGKIKALKVGTVTITITSSSETRASATIEVEVYEPDFFEVSYETNSYVLEGETIKLNANAHLRGYTNPKLVWGVVDGTVASVSNDGVVTGKKAGYTKVRVYVEEKEDFYFDFGVTVYSASTSDAVKRIIESNNSNVKVTYNLGIGAGAPAYYMDVIDSVSRLIYNYNYALNTKYESVQKAVSSNHGEAQTKTEFITVHYTGNMAAGANANANANYFANGGGGTSIHYVTGNDGIYHVLDDKLIGFHAGDGHSGDSEIAWYPTGVMYKEGDPIYPEWGISENSKYVLNGEETTITVPTGTTSQTTKVTSSKWINKMGFGYKIVNGEYYMAKTWWCYTQVSEGRLCNKGGNMNSIGIESAVNQGSDLWYTWHLTAQLVAHLMRDNDLPIQRVVGHHFYSAKDCPQPFLANGLDLWWDFIDAVEAEYDMLTKYSDYTYTMKLDGTYSNVTTNGRIQDTNNEYQLVTYTVTVKDKSGKTENVTLSCIVPGDYNK